MDLGLAGLKAVVTGGTKGIGRAVADHFAREGADVAICARNAGEVTDAVAALSATGVHHMPSLFIGCLDASILVNGKRLPGSTMPREVAGRKISSAMLAFSETWIRAEPGSP